MPSKRYPTWRNRHEAVFLYMFAHQAARYYAIARERGNSQTQLCRIVNAPESRRRYRAHLHAAADEAARRILVGLKRQL